MAHPRKLIRLAAVSALKLANTSAGQRVIPSKMVPWRDIELPAIGVYILDELVDEESADSAPRKLLRTADLTIIGAVKAGVGVDNALDDLAEQIEQAIEVDPMLAGTAEDCFLRQTEIGIPEEGTSERGMIRLVYRASYWRYSTPSGTAVDFKTAVVNYNPEGVVAPADQAVDRLENLDQ